MPVTEYERHQLFVWFEGQLGPERATNHDLDRLRSDLQRTLGTWIFASQAAVIAAMGLLLGLSH